MAHMSISRVRETVSNMISNMVSDILSVRQVLGQMTLDLGGMTIHAVKFGTLL